MGKKVIQGPVMDFFTCVTHLLRINLRPLISEARFATIAPLGAL